MAIKSYRNFLSYRNASGTSLTELMIAIGLSLLILLILVQQFFALRLSIETSHEYLKLQEIANTALNILVKNIRNAGFLGCNDNAGADILSLQGFNQQTVKNFPFAPQNMLKDSEALLISYANPASASLTLNMINSSQFYVSLGLKIAPGERLVLTDCLHHEIVQVEAIKKLHDQFEITSQKKMKYFFHKNTQVRLLKTNLYYAGTSDYAQTGEKTYALFQKDLLNPTKPNELLPGVTDLRFTFGAASHGTLKYLKLQEITDWHKVVSILISLCVGSSHQAQKINKEWVRYVQLQNKT